ncbi:MAG: autotransporter domain-containing protein [Pseudomonadota bacterium]
MINRKERRRAQALARKQRSGRNDGPGQGRSLPCPAPRQSARNALIGAAAGALALSVPASGTHAQTVIPPSGGPCVVVGTTATCTGDVSAGVYARAPLTTLTINSLTQDIAPAPLFDGAFFISAGSIAIESDTGAFRVITTGSDADGIYGISTGTGTVAITHTGDISTSGNTSEAILAYANNTITIRHTGNLSTVGVASDAIDSYVRAGGSVTVTQTGNISTAEFFARGINIGATGGGSVTIRQTGTVSTTGRDGEAIRGFAYTGGGVEITQTGTITTTGPDANGINANTFGGGSVTVNQTGDITVSGLDASAVLATAPGATATVTLAGGTTQGGSGNGAGVAFSTTAGTTNILNVEEAHTVSALSGTAVLGGAGAETINNRGTIVGTLSLGDGNDGFFNAGTFTGTADLGDGDNIVSNTSPTSFNGVLTTGAGNDTVTNSGAFTGTFDLGGGTNAFNNVAGGVLNSGASLSAGAGNTLINSGTLSPGGSNAIQTTALAGNLVQNSGGLFLIDVDPSAGTGDLVTVTGTANLAGTVQTNFINPVVGPRSQTILTAAGGTIDNGLAVGPLSPAVQASLSFPNANDVVLTYSIDFSADGLSPDSTSVADSLNTALTAGGGGLDPLLVPLLNNVFSIDAYQNALNQLLPEVYLNTETATLFSSEDFIENLFSCRLAGQNHTALSEGECLWARPQGRFFDRDSDNKTIGFDEIASSLAAGAQVAVARNWFAGFALGYERAALDTDTGAEADSNRFSGGLSLKFQAESFMLGAAISGGLSGNNTERPISFAGFSGMAESNYAIKTLSGQARAAYVFQLRDWFAKPMVDVTATYLSRDGVTETGAGAANLAIGGSDDVFFSVTPALEIGGDFALSDTSTLRPYVRAGVSFYTDSDHGLAASFVNAPAGTNAFSITSDFDDVFADIAAGATAFFDNGSTLGLSYEGLISSDTRQHGISLKGTIAF